MPLKIFICYAHKDEQYLNNLKSHLRPLQEEGLIKIWSDRNISAGTEWEREIRHQLNAADIILLMISADFMNSKYCYSIELKQAIERHECGEAKVIPIILREVYWQGILGKLQALPTNARPVTGASWHDIDAAFYDVTKGIQATAELLLKERRGQREQYEQNFGQRPQRRQPLPKPGQRPTSIGTNQKQSLKDVQYDELLSLNYPYASTPLPLKRLQTSHKIQEQFGRWPDFLSSWKVIIPAIAVIMLLALYLASTLFPSSHPLLWVPTFFGSSNGPISTVTSTPKTPTLTPSSTQHLGSP